MKPIQSIPVILIILAASCCFAQEIPPKANPFVKIGRKYILELYENPKIRKGFVEDYGKFVERASEIYPLGSGTIITKEGLILTNNHVGEEAEPEFKLSEDSKKLILYYPASEDLYIYELNNDFLLPPVMKYRAAIIGADPGADMMVLRIRETLDGTSVYYPDFDYIEFGNPYKLPLNSPLSIVGYPGAAGSTATITSGRFLGYYLQNEQSQGLIKTDAAISPGNSGGAALNGNKLIGVPSNVTLNAEGSTYGLISPVAWNASSLIMAKNKYGEKIPAIDEEWFKSDYYMGIAKNNLYVTGKVFSQQTNQSVPEATILFYRKNADYESIKELYKEVQMIQFILYIQELNKSGVSVKNLSKTFKIPSGEIEKILAINTEKLISVLSPQAKRMIIDKEFFYSACTSDEMGFFMTYVPRGIEVRMEVIKSGYREYSKSFLTGDMVNNDLGRITLLQY